MVRRQPPLSKGRGRSFSQWGTVPAPVPATDGQHFRPTRWLQRRSPAPRHFLPWLGRHWSKCLEWRRYWPTALPMADGSMSFPPKIRARLLSADITSKFHVADRQSPAAFYPVYSTSPQASSPTAHCENTRITERVAKFGTSRFIRVSNSKKGRQLKSFQAPL